jgi:hypothetical protein
MKGFLLSIHNSGGTIMLTLKLSDSSSINTDLSEFLGEHVANIIIQNMEKMDFDELVEFRKSLEIISKVIR